MTTKPKNDAVTAPTKLTPEQLETQLAAAPWLRPYCRVGDVSLEPARRRFDDEQRATTRLLRRQRVTIPVRYHGSGHLLTTSYEAASHVVDLTSATEATT